MIDCAWFSGLPRSIPSTATAQLLPRYLAFSTGAPIWAAVPRCHRTWDFCKSLVGSMITTRASDDDSASPVRSASGREYLGQNSTCLIRVAVYDSYGKLANRIVAS